MKMIRVQFANINVRFIDASFCLWIIGTLLGSCDRLKGITTIYGTVTEPGYGTVDSARIVFIARQTMTNTKFVAETLTDANGKYRVTVDAPRGYGRVECDLILDGSPTTQQYTKGEAWQDGRKLNTCCGVSAGAKANFDFKLFK